MTRMVRSFRIAFWLFLVPLSWLLLPAQEPSTDSGRVIGIFDGDTIRVRLEGGREKTVRLLGVNAPELNDPRQDVQFFAQMAKRFAFFHLQQKEISLTYDWEREDKYGRTLAYIWNKPDRLFNEFIIREGFAFAFLKYPFRKDLQGRFRAAESEAKASGKGLWKKGNYRAVSSAAAAQNVGTLLSVEFLCRQVLTEKQSVLLLAADGEFQAFIPRESAPLFPDIASFKGQVLTATGFLELYNERLETKIFFPFQLKKRNARAPFVPEAGGEKRERVLSPSGFVL